MTDHAAEALRLVNGDAQDCAAAQVYATLELAKWVREIADQLDVRSKRGRGRPPAPSRVRVP